MSFSVGIVGLPNAGKSTLFKALTNQSVAIAEYPFTTIEPNVGKVAVPDERLEKIASLVRPEKTTPTFIEFIDIAGLVKGAHKGEGLGNQFLSHVRACDAIIEVICAFGQESAPQEDITILETELLMKDSETIESVIEKLTKRKEAAKILEVLRILQAAVSKGTFIVDFPLDEEQKEEIYPFQFLTAKPRIHLFNTNSDSKSTNKTLSLNLKEEQEISELSKQEQEELGMRPHLDQLIEACYTILNLITFFTIKGATEVKAWTLLEGAGILEAAYKVHSDFAEQFIRAEVIPWQELAKIQSQTKAKEKGLLRTVGKEYIVRNGDVIEFKT